jgi:hypothetical protein
MNNKRKMKKKNKAWVSDSRGLCAHVQLCAARDALSMASQSQISEPSITPSPVSPGILWAFKCLQNLWGPWLSVAVHLGKGASHSGKELDTILRCWASSMCWRLTLSCKGTCSARRPLPGHGSLCCSIATATAGGAPHPGHLSSAGSGALSRIPSYHRVQWENKGGRDWILHTHSLNNKIHIEPLSCHIDFFVVLFESFSKQWNFYSRR